MTIKIKSNIKELMTQKGLNIAEVRKKTGLPHIAILNASSDKIEFTGLNVLSKIARALDVTIKELFEEKNLSKKQPADRKRTSCEANISSVTNQLISLIMKMKTTDKDKLVEKYNELNKSPSKLTNVSNVTSHLVDLVMTMSLEDRCKLLGELISYSGLTKRKYSRKEFITPLHFTVNNKLYHGNTKNISLGGVFIEIGNPTALFSVGDAIKMNMAHPETHKHFNVSGKIVWMGKNGMGVEFDEPL